ncbi:MAG TPA: hypothetical protein VGM12_15300 [Trebonia sp.]
MPEKITYYALIDSRSSRERPRTVHRRIEKEGGQTDELFSRDLTWESSPLLYGAERGDTMIEFVPVTEDEANRIVERIRAEAAQAE